MSQTLLSLKELEAVREKFPVALRRAHALRLLMKLGFTRGKARSLIEGNDAPLAPLPHRKPNQWAREAILDQFNSTPPAA